MSTRKPGVKAPQTRHSRKSKLKDLAPTKRAAQGVKGGRVGKYIGETEKN